MGKSLAFLLVSVVFLGSLCSPVAARQIPKEDYIDYLPLKNLRITRQAEATAAFALYGDTNDPSYRDVVLLDGIDDTRHALLMDLAVHFAPYMVQNSTAIPMSHKKFWDRNASYPLYVDTWDVSMEKPEIVHTETIDFVALPADPCQASAAARGGADSSAQGAAAAVEPDPASNDCRLLALLEEFHPDRPTNERFHTTAKTPGRDLFKVMYFDFPGRTPREWRDLYVEPLSQCLPREYHDFLKAYVHPFIHTVRSNNDGVLGYEFVLHYWFFYPFNDGGNNHSGDWSHINVVISPLSRLGQPLEAPDIRRLLTNGLSAPADDPLVISRVEYYFHHRVLTVDYTDPNVYLPRAQWEARRKQRIEERFGEAKMWDRIRRSAYNDEEETLINTHPIVYIGSDNKGLDQLLVAPGGWGRDSHGSYPFPGLYKGSGPSLAAEQIDSYFDHRAYYQKTASNPPADETCFGRGNMVPLDDPDLLEMVPDWERLIDLVHSNPEARREWSWLVLPIRWGFPAVESPAAGIIKNANTGNSSIPAMAYISGGWNSVGSNIYSQSYVPHVIPAIFPQQWQDNFINGWGILNITLPTLVSLPPFDIVWRVISSPLHVFSKKSTPIFYPLTRMPFRFAGVSPGVSYQRVPDDFLDLATAHKLQFDEFFNRVDEHVAEHGLEDENAIFLRDTESNTSAVGQVSFYLGGRLVSENTLRHTRNTLHATSTFSVPLAYRSELNLWEYAGSIRFNLSKGGFRPSLIAGYGLSWYRLEKASVNGTLLDASTTPWVRRPSVKRLKNLLPNTFHLGIGAEFIAIKSVRGIDISLSADYRAYTHKLGVELAEAPLSSFVELGFTSDQFPVNKRVWRHTFNGLFTISF